jgi:hypothetical protein
MDTEGRLLGVLQIGVCGRPESTWLIGSAPTLLASRVGGKKKPDNSLSFSLPVAIL